MEEMFYCQYDIQRHKLKYFICRLCDGSFPNSVKIVRQCCQENKRNTERVNRQNKKNPDRPKLINSEIARSSL